MPDSMGDAAQIRLIGEQIADAAIVRFNAQHPEIRKGIEIPAPIKWAAGILASLLTAGIAAMALWLVSTVNTMQLTLARMDERMGSQAASQDGRYVDIERRIVKLEAFHAGGGR